MAEAEQQQTPTTAGWRALLGRLRERFDPATLRGAPDYGPDAPEDPRLAWLRQLARTRELLEQAREVVAHDGWAGGGAWFTVPTAGGGSRAATLAESFALRAPGAEVTGACLVGILVRIADDPDRVPTVADVWRAVDELHEAVHERDGHVAGRPGAAYPLTRRRAHLRTLTAWNDEPHRTAADVMELIDRAVARTIVGAVA